MFFVGRINISKFKNFLKSVKEESNGHNDCFEDLNNIMGLT